MKIWIEAKNPALHSAGIGAWLQDLTEDLDSDLLKSMVLVYPHLSDPKVYPELNVERLELPWFSWLPGKVAHLVYNHVTFPFFALIKKPNLVFSPYFDVAIPKSIPSIITVHDLCFFEVPNLYPRIRRQYFVCRMKQAVSRAQSVITVSKTSRDQLVQKLAIPVTSIHVIANKVSEIFLNFIPSSQDIESFNKKYGGNSIKVLYTSGFENRKNVPNLLQSFRILLEKNSNYLLMVTGEEKTKWLKVIAGDEYLLSRVVFLGHLSVHELKTAYMCSNIVVCPSFSEGFGRACIEAMSVGTPLACSNLEVFREIAGEYPIFFNPKEPKDMANAIAAASQKGKQSPVDFNKQMQQRSVSHFSKMLSERSRK